MSRTRDVDVPHSKFDRGRDLGAEWVSWVQYPPREGAWFSGRQITGGVMVTFSLGSENSNSRPSPPRPRITNEVCTRVSGSGANTSRRIEIALCARRTRYFGTALGGIQNGCQCRATDDEHLCAPGT